MTNALTIHGTWKRKWGFTGATFLAYLVASEPKDKAEWFPAPVSTLYRTFGISPDYAQKAREKLQSEGVIEVTDLQQGRNQGYRYKINHSVLRSINKESEK